jgi:hypothetical protein
MSNTSYYCAIQVIDDSGNRSPVGTLTNSNVDAACSGDCPVRTAMRQQWNLVSLPVVPSNPAPAAVFGNLDGVTDFCGPGDLPCLYTWVSTGVPTLTDDAGCYELMGDPGPDLDPTDGCVPNANPVTAGEGYFFDTFALLPMTATGADIPAVTDDGHDPSDDIPHAHLPLQQGWNLIGNLFKADVLLNDVNVRRSDNMVLTFAQAVLGPDTLPNTGDEWVDGAIYVLTSGSGDQFQTVPFNDPVNPARLKPWQGYWFLVLQDDTFSYELLIPEP